MESSPPPGFDLTTVNRIVNVRSSEVDDYLNAGWILLAVEKSFIPSFGTNLDEVVTMSLGWNRPDTPARPKSRVTQSWLDEARR